MSVNATLPLLYVQQQGPTGRLVHDIATHPEASQAMSRHVAEALLRQESEQVQKTADPDLPSSIREEEQEQEESRQQGRNKRKDTPEEPPPNLETSPSVEGPLLGNLVNRKV
ncbi:MAG: hypothetical protein RR014_05250 [Bilophila sp.]